jgi:hypothetical protein
MSCLQRDCRFKGGFYLVLAEDLFEGFEGLGGLFVLGGELFVLLGEFGDAVGHVVGAEALLVIAAGQGTVLCPVYFFTANLKLFFSFSIKFITFYTKTENRPLVKTSSIPHKPEFALLKSYDFPCAFGKIVV